jgi:pyruvate ferredoxin oxidoreductase alpha subunit
MENKPKVISFIGGLGGRDIPVAGFKELVKRGKEIAANGSPREFEIFGVRE